MMLQVEDLFDTIFAKVRDRDCFGEAKKRLIEDLKLQGFNINIIFTQQRIYWRPLFFR